MEKKTALVIGALAIVAGLVVLSGVAYATGGRFAAQGAYGNGMMGGSAAYHGGMGQYQGNMMGGYSGGMMGGCGGMTWSNANGTSCPVYQGHCQWSNGAP